VSEVDPDPNRPLDEQGRPILGGREEPATGDPTEGGKRGEIGEAPSVAADEPVDGGTYPPGGGNVTEEPDAAPVTDPGPDA
jgi:hypothetical protein